MDLTLSFLDNQDFSDDYPLDSSILKDLTITNESDNSSGFRDK